MIYKLPLQLVRIMLVFLNKSTCFDQKRRTFRHLGYAYVTSCVKSETFIMQTTCHLISDYQQLKETIDHWIRCMLWRWSVIWHFVLLSRVKFNIIIKSDCKICIISRNTSHFMGGCFRIRQA